MNSQTRRNLASIGAIAGVFIIGVMITGMNAKISQQEKQINDLQERVDVLSGYITIDGLPYVVTGLKVAQLTPGQRGYVAMDVFGQNAQGELYVQGIAVVKELPDADFYICVEMNASTEQLRLCDLVVPPHSTIVDLPYGQEHWLPISSG